MSYSYLDYILSNVNIAKKEKEFKKKKKFFVPFAFLSSLPSSIKGPLSGLRQFLATESPLKMMKNAFYFTSKALFVLKIFKFLS